MGKKMEFFIYLLEKYAEYKKTSVAETLQILDKLDLTEFIYKLYEMYHVEAIENAYADIDELIRERLVSKKKR